MIKLVEHAFRSHIHSQMMSATLPEIWEPCRSTSYLVAQVEACAKGPECTSEESVAGVLWVYISLCLGLRLLKVEESGFPKTRLFFLYDKSIFWGYYRILSHCIFQTTLCSIPLESKSSYGFTSSPGSFCSRAVCPPHLVPFVFPLYYWYFHIRAASQEMFKDLFMKLLLEVFPEVLSHHTIPSHHHHHYHHSLEPGF